jgi:uncharacterized membrane protein
MSGSETGTYQLPVSIRSLDVVDRSSDWLGQGWRDFKKAPAVSLAYGGAIVILGLVLTIGLVSSGLGSMILPLAGGLMILAPILVVGLYDVARCLEAGLPVSLANCFHAFGRSAGQLAAMGIILLLCYLVWVQCALFLFALFFSHQPPPLDRFLQEVAFSTQGAILLILGSIVGAVFAAVVFGITAVSIPLIYDRPVDVITAVGVSLLAVRENFKLMFGWAALIAVLTVMGIATAFVGLAVVLPVLAYATWHAYRDLVAGGPVYPEDAATLPPSPNAASGAMP